MLARTTIANDDVTATRVAPGVEQLRIAAFTAGVGRWIYEQVDRAAHGGRQVVEGGVGIAHRSAGGSAAEQAIHVLNRRQRG